MAKSRKRLARRHIHPKKKFVNPLTLDGLFDVLVNESIRPKPAEVLYHYTDWNSARGILLGQHFWETAHDCTNDEAELISARSVILEVAETLKQEAQGIVATALDLFLRSYLRLQVNKLKTIYLACFSLARDDREQWRKYADNGRGLCLGVRVLNELIPTPKDTGSALIQVDYSEESWRNQLMSDFKQICTALSRARYSKHNIGLGSSALYRIAAFASIRAKQPKWAVEQEIRHATLIRDGANLRPKERIRDGKVIRYLDNIELRTAGKKLAFAEIIVGPNQNPEEVTKRVAALLAQAGYQPGTSEYPEVTISQINDWTQTQKEEGIITASA